MIGKLRRRFILVAMASVFTVLAVIMGTVNIMNYRKILTDAVNETIDNFRIPIEAAGKKLTCEVEKNLTLKGEEQQIRKVLSIRMDNALKYSCENGEISVRVFQHGKWKHILVENQTTDQKQGDLKEVFERFYRADASRSSEIPGYGIGLSTAQTVVQAHKGKISARGEGDRFWIEMMLP